MLKPFVLVSLFVAGSAFAQTPAEPPKVNKAPGTTQSAKPPVQGLNVKPMDFTAEDVKKVLEALPHMARWVERSGKPIMPEQLAVLAATPKMRDVCADQALDCPYLAPRVACVLSTYTTLHLEKMRDEILKQVEPYLKDPNLSDSHKELIRKSAEAPFADPMVQQVATLATPSNRQVIVPFIPQLDALFKKL